MKGWVVKWSLTHEEFDYYKFTDVRTVYREYKSNPFTTQQAANEYLYYIQNKKYPPGIEVDFTMIYLEDLPPTDAWVTDGLSCWAIPDPSPLEIL